ncbi:arabinan endo-1,5-alpha-L-arabinosidase [Segetibacter sp. 3557_3]|uniref:family 43 glycosylhydrolase n=1 Tax=Segetibacter sp. 3557_3 TaxID=2547429 RepID=UPI001058D87C|nr:family 43 glycosylhydrolase [Segetibacter sp. 3557_3]TDH28900.1 arabinan endo-1,5-alpha-L-arabinosidase [Segetibacter sp. 3557_3]
MKRNLLTIAFALLTTLSNGQQTTATDSAGSQQAQPPRRFRPVIGELTTSPGVHDPVMAKEGDTYYVFHTGAGIWSSKDMITWKRERPVFDSSNTPTWLKGAGFSRPGYWAPDIFFHNGQWLLYYSNSAFGKNTSAIGVATNKTLNPSSPDYKWVDQGKIVQTYPGKTNYNAIDPAVIYDDKTKSPWMTYGSFWHGMQLVKLSRDGLRLADPNDSIKLNTVSSRMTDPSAPNPPSNGVHPADAGGNAIEAPFLFKKGKYYYLFVSFDYCCSGVKSDYKIAVGRSTKIQGPYLDKNGVDMARGGGTIIREGDKKEFYAVGHNSAYTFNKIDYLVYHGYSVAENAASKLVIETMEWDKNGWPVVGKRITPKPAGK